jgi:hypothetical protein
LNSTELLDLFRREMADTAKPYLWSDDDVYGYIDDAQKMFCRKTDGIADATTQAVVEIYLEAGDDWVDLHPSILTIRDVSRSDGCPVEVLNREDMPSRGLRFDGLAGQVRRLVIGMQENKARVHPVSNEETTLHLIVYRLPLEDITFDGDQEFEVGSQHHPHLLAWVKARAYGKQDADTVDEKKKLKFEGEFLAYCRAVKLEQARKRHKPRTVMYGGL